MQTVILASASAQRKKIMEAFGIDFEVMPADVDEKSIRDNDLALRAEKIACLKGEYIAQKNNGIIISADTFVSVDGEVLEKPEDFDEARAMLNLISGNKVRVYTGYCYIDNQNNIKESSTVITDVVFRDLSDQEIENAINNLPVLTWSGAFNVMYVECGVLTQKINGSLTSMYGLPMEVIVPLLRKSGLKK